MQRQLVKPPIDDNLIAFQFPSFRTNVLENGLTLLVLENPKIPKVYFRLGIDFGEKNDSPNGIGAVELLAQVLKKGTANRSYAEIVDEIDFVGGSLRVSSSADFFNVAGHFLNEYSDTGLELMSDVVLNPVFDKNEIEKERRKLISYIENEKSTPVFLAQRRMKKVLFSPHPYSGSKTPESIDQISREILVELYQKLVDPAHTYLVIAGDISFDEAVEKTIKDFGGWEKRASEQIPDFPLPEVGKQRKVYLIDRPKSEQCSILLGRLLFNRRNEEFEKFHVMNHILGGGASGRLFMTLREEKGYTYGSYSAMSCHKETGGWQATAEVRTEVTAAAIDTFFEEFEKMKNDAVSDEELKNAKRYLIGCFPIKNETPASLAALELQKRLHDLPEDYWNNFLKNIDQISKNDVRQMAEKYLDKNGLAIVVVGDREKIQKQLEKFGEIEIYDLDDRLIDGKRNNGVIEY